MYDWIYPLDDVECLCGGCKRSLRITSYFNYMYVVLVCLDHGLYIVLVKLGSALALGGNYINKQPQLNRRCYFSVQSYASINVSFTFRMHFYTSIDKTL